MTRLSWGGVAADYTPAEQAFMRALADTGAKEELAVVHRIKAEFPGSVLRDPSAPSAAPEQRACGIAAHAGQTWTNHSGRPVCLICHPPVDGAAA